MKLKNGISVVMVVHNEEQLLSRALESVKGVADEILVVHDGECGDKSLEIAKKYQARVWTRPFEGIAEPHRVWTYEQAEYKWLLQLDADEYLSDELRKNVRKLAEAEGVDCYEFVWPLWNGQKYTSAHWPFKKAMFRKDHIRFLGFPHSEVWPEGKIQKTDLVLEHRPMYNNFAWVTFQKKWRKWTQIHARYVLKDPSEFEYFPRDKKMPLPRYFILGRHPKLLTLPLAIYQGAMALKTGAVEGGWAGIKSAGMIFLYYFYLGMEVARVKRESTA